MHQSPSYVTTSFFSLLLFTGSLGSIPDIASMLRSFSPSSSYLREQELGYVILKLVCFAGLLGSTITDADSSTCVMLYIFKGCLLYTSTSPRDRTRYRMPSSA